MLSYTLRDTLQKTPYLKCYFLKEQAEGQFYTITSVCNSTHLWAGIMQPTFFPTKIKVESGMNVVTQTTNVLTNVLHTVLLTHSHHCTALKLQVLNVYCSNVNLDPKEQTSGSQLPQRDCKIVSFLFIELIIYKTFLKMGKYLTCLLGKLESINCLSVNLH